MDGVIFSPLLPYETRNLLLLDMAPNFFFVKIVITFFYIFYTYNHSPAKSFKNETNARSCFCPDRSHFWHSLRKRNVSGWILISCKLKLPTTRQIVGRLCLQQSVFLEEMEKTKCVEGVNNGIQATKDDVNKAVNCIETVVHTASDEIIDAFKDEMNKFSGNHGEQVNTNVEKLVNGQNAVLEAVDGMVNYMKDEVTAANENAKKHAHISHQVRGQLGAEVRKQRKEDADEIERLRDVNDRMLKYFLENLRDNSALVAKMTDMRPR